jgi:nucleoside-diphosphate-sugar epimerase
MKNILITGAFGQIGSELVPALQQQFGKDNVIAGYNNTLPDDFDGIAVKCDATDKEQMRAIIEEHNIDTIYHLVSILSAKGEVDPVFTWNTNMDSLRHVLDLAVEYKLRIFWPSSIAAFGPTTPRVDTPQHTVLEPSTMYGVTKVAGELLCQYYFNKFGVDVRSVRYPGIISWKTPPGGGTTDFAVAIFYDGLQTGKYDCFVKPETKLPMMYMDDAVKATIDLMNAPAETLTVRTSYNLAAISFTAQELAEEINKQLPVAVTYNPDHRQAIADSWPQTIDDAAARKDWGWNHAFDLTKMTEVMILELKKKFGIQ